MDFTLIIVVITGIVSFAAFSNQQLMNKLILYPNGMNGPSEYHRFITSGFIHADWMHLLLNMYVLYIFGQQVEFVFTNTLQKPYLFPVLYMSALVASSLPSFAKHRNNYYYSALGASGAVAAVMFSYIYYAPWSTLLFFFIPMPAIVFGIAYLAYSAYAARKGQDNIGHDAHFYGAVFGFIFTLIFDPSHGMDFIEKIMHPTFRI